MSIAAAAERWASAGLVRLDTDDLSALYSDAGVVTLYGRTLSPGATIAISMLREVAGRLIDTELNA